MKRITVCLRPFGWAVLLALFTAKLPADGQAAEPTDDRSAKLKQVVTKARRYLSEQGQAKDGSYSSFAGTGPTALITTALLRHGASPESPEVAKSLKYLESFVQSDGGIHPKDSLYRNYETCLAIMCLTEANRDGRYDTVIRKANQFIRQIQWGENYGITEKDPAYGGGGYGRHKRPDLSNTSFLVDALKAVDAEGNDEALKRALVFVSRCQNLESPHNTTEFSAKVNDGGFYYSAAAGGSSQAGETANGGLRSYAAMTYAGLKSMLYAGVDGNDPRVQAAVGWIKKHYDVQSNPGMGDAGLFYYYHVFAKAFHAIGEPQIVSADGKQHDWQADLIDELARRQRANGSWVNENDRWLEGDANLATGFALLALSYCEAAGSP